MPMTDNDTDTKPLHGPNLILDVENFGPIAEAKNIEFRPMTVFVGPSNTGKSYLATLLHAILKAKNGDLLRSGAAPPSTGSFVRSSDQSDLKATISELQKFLSLSDRRRLGSLTSVYEFDQMTPKFRDFVFSASEFWLRSFAQRALSEVERYFQRELGDLISGHSDAQHYTARFFSTSEGCPVTTLTGTRYRVSAMRNLDIVVDDIFTSLLLSHETGDSSNGFFVELGFVDVLDSSVSRHMDAYVRSHYAPAGRTGILAGKSLLTAAILANLDKFGIDSLEIGQLNPIAREFLGMLSRGGDGPYVLRGDSARKFLFDRGGDISIVAEVMEEKLLRGRIIEHREGIENESLVYESDTFRGRLGLASSMVTEIAPLIIAIRNDIRLGELLIIDEPEAHLHPEAQQKMAAVLAYMIRQGMRVLITTHSHYIVEQLGALVNAGAVSVDPDERKRHLGLLGRDIDHGLYLKQEEVAVYEFEPRGKFGSPSEVSEVEFDGDNLGYYPLGYSKALADQRNRNIRMIGAREGF